MILAKVPRSLAQAVTTCSAVLQATISNQIPTQTILTDRFRGFSHSLQANSGIVRNWLSYCQSYDVEDNNMQFEERYDVTEESVLICLFLVREDVLAAVDFPPYLKVFI
jgi:hypothetical protein